MSRSRIRRAHPALATAITLLLLATSVSPASAAIHTAGAVLVTASVFAATYADVGARVDCPAGHVVISGGASWVVGSLPQETSQAKNRYLDASRPVDGGRAWYAVGSNLNADATFRVAAWCLPETEVGPLVVRRRTLPAARHPTGGVSCPEGHRAISGGASLQEAGEPLTPAISENGPLSALMIRSDGRGWVAGAIRNSGSTARLRLIVLCRPDATVGRYQRVTEVAPTGQTRARVAYCQGGAGVMGGGAAWQTAGGSILGGIGILSSSSPDVTYGGEWFASGRNRWTAAEVVLKVTAVCRPR